MSCTNWQPGDFYAPNGIHCNHLGFPVCIARPEKIGQYRCDWPHASPRHTLGSSPQTDDPRWKELAELKRRIREIEQQLGI